MRLGDAGAGQARGQPNAGAHGILDVKQFPRWKLSTNDAAGLAGHNERLLAPRGGP